MKNDLQTILYDEAAIKQKVAELGAAIARDYQGKSLVLIGIMKGAVPFVADLMRAIDLPLSYDLMAVSSYGASTKSSGTVRILKDIDLSIEGQDVMIVEDIIDTGLTLHYLVENLKSRKPNSLKICTLLDKPSRRKVEIKPDYNGFAIPDAFVVGYGLDYAEKYRNLPYIGVLKEAVYKES
ncbi:MAG TPA: hypoxanthine phosphoribosyltransferase [Bacillota bacterium]|nr:hypoxanthine phosphoribosyltransferase [Bacillota bacterium]